MQKIVDRLYSVKNRLLGRVYLIEGESGLTLVDTSMPGSVSAIEADLQSAGLKLAEVRHILITHAHIDHIGGLSGIQKRIAELGGKVTTYVRHKDAQITRSGSPPVLPAKDTLDPLQRMAQGNGNPSPPATVDVELTDHQTLDHILPGLTVIPEPGHTYGQVGYYWASQKLMLCGDLVANIFGFRRPFPAFTPDMAEAYRSMRRVSQMDVETLCFGHGNPVLSGGNVALANFVSRFGA
jgi:glyoxylase-like metal-dependent hydrolase (beta-lactamase superfamily II)